MLKRKKILLIICFAALCLSSTPIYADLFHFEVTRLLMAFDGTRFNASLYDPFGELTLTRDVAPVETVYLQPWKTGLGSGGLSLWMDLDNITASTATAIGEVTITDVDGDTITGDFTGNWVLIGDYPSFSGEMSNIQWSNPGGFFNGNDGSPDNSLSLDFASLPPWTGSIIELTTGHTSWFTYPWPTKMGGGIEGVIVPTPAAVLLGILGLGAVGLKLRKYA